MGKNTKKKTSAHQTSSLKEHQHIGKQLHPPLAKLNVKPVRYSIDVLPELLLIDAIVHKFSWSVAPDILHQMFDILDQFVPLDSSEVLVGLVSGMHLIPEEKRSDARKTLIKVRLDTDIWPDGFLHALALYPQCPALWLFDDWKNGNTVEWEEGISYLKGAVRRLWNSKGVYSTRCRMFPLARMAKHGKLHFMRTPEQEHLVDLLVGYPTKLTEDEQRQAEASSRSMFMVLSALMMGEKRPDWVPYFWRKNYDLSSCEQLGDTREVHVIRDEIVSLLSAVKKSATNVTV